MAGALAHCPLVRLSQSGELPLAPDHRRVETARPARKVLLERQQTVGAYEIALALELERLDRPDAHRVPDEPVGRLAEQDLTRRRGFLEALCDIDCVAGGEALAAARVPGDDLAGIDARSHR